MRTVLRRSAALVALGATALASAAVLAGRAFERRVTEAQDRLLDAAHGSPPTGRSGGTPDAAPDVVAEEMLADLPAPIQRYLRHANVVGRPVPRMVRLAQHGGMHPAPSGPWLPLRAEQVYTTDPPGFVWDATIFAGPLPVLRGCDSFVAGRGRMDIRAAAIVPIVDETGEEIDQAALVRYLSEMIWFPMAFLRPGITFEAIDDRHARVTLTAYGRAASGVMSVDGEGRLEAFVAQRHRFVDGQHVLTTWSTPVTEYGVLAGMRLPVRGKAVWNLPEGDLEYIDVEIADLRLEPATTGGR